MGLSKSSTMMGALKDDCNVLSLGHGGSDGLHGYVPSLDYVVEDTAALYPRIEAMVEGIVLTSPAIRVKQAHPIVGAVAPILSLVLPKFQFKGANRRRIPVSRDPAAMLAKYSDPLVYTGPIRVRTGHEILRLSSYLLQNMKSITVPFFVLHGTADRITDPLASQDLYNVAASRHKDLKLYEGFLHDLLFEPERDECAGQKNQPDLQLHLFQEFHRSWFPGIARQIKAAHGWSLPCKKVTMNAEEERDAQDLKDTGMKIVEKCGGLPLAIKTIAGVLCKRGLDRSAWAEVLRSAAWSRTGLPEGVHGTLYLSYQDLPAHLKQCFLYSALLREDYAFQMSAIIRLWIAEGFVEAQGDVSLEETGEQYYKELLHRSLLQSQPFHPNQLCEIFLPCRLQREIAFCVDKPLGDPQLADVCPDERLVFTE
ncbi:Monoglyceride lipase [Musa troglodytarum]|uniref:Monoglyceride lipase n=1 Tax=Musa troglodytarum TaxID=320322 RepID=A0A9E7LD07_9LILI|nr:Monoglyceride lipase [Musa troglodytarum]URE49011.1 Monoglyceride lipase [Musa troglodytarum]